MCGIRIDDGADGADADADAATASVLDLDVGDFAGKGGVGWAVGTDGTVGSMDEGGFRVSTRCRSASNILSSASATSRCDVSIQCSAAAAATPRALRFSASLTFFTVLPAALASRWGEGRDEKEKRKRKRKRGRERKRRER